MTTPSGDMGLGNARGFVDISTQGAIANLQRLRQQVRSVVGNISSSFQQAGQTISNFGAGLSIAMLPVAGAFKQGISAAGNFQDAMAEIAARTGLTGNALDEIRQKALQMGADTSFSAQQSADAFLQLLASGSSASESMQQIEAVLRGAEASGSDLAFTADALTDIMAAMGLEASQSTEVMDALIDATGSSSATFNDLAAGFANIGPMARNMGLSVGETAATLAVFSENGIKGAEAGTQLRSMLNNMIRDTEDVQGMWAKLGVSMFDANGQARDLNDVIVDLNRAMEGMSDQERTEVITTLAGTYGQLGLSALLATGGISEMQAKMETQTSFVEIAKQRMATFQGQLTSLKGSIETLLISAFTPFIEFLTPFVTQLVDVVNRVREWVEANQAVVQPILRMLSVLIMLGPTLFGVGKAISFIGFLIGALTSPINLVLIAITALVAAWTSDFMGLRTTLQPVVDNIIAMFRGLWEAIQVGGLGGGATFIFDNIINPLIQQISTYVGSGQLWEQAKALGASIFNALRIGIPAVATWVLNHIVMPLYNSFSTAILGVNWAQVGSNILSALGSALQTAGNWAAWVLQNFLIPLFNSVRTAIANIDWGQVATTLMTALGSAILGLASAVTWINTNLLTPLFNTAKTALMSIDWGQLGRDIVAFIFSPFTGGGEDTGAVDWGAVFNSLMNAIANVAKTIFDFNVWCIQNVVMPLVQGLIQGLAETDWGEVANGIMNAIAGAITAVINFLQWVMDHIISPLIQNAANAISTTDWGAVGRGIMDGIANALPNIGQWVNNHIIAPIRNALSNFNPMGEINTGGGGPNFGGQVVTSAATAAIPGASILQPLLNSFLSRDNGGFGMANRPVTIGTGAQPEVFVPRTSGDFYPRGQMGNQISVQTGPIYANSYEGGQAAARGFRDELQELLRSS